MVKKVTDTYVQQKCEECKAVRKILNVELLAGLDGDLNIVMLPKCSCGAHEFLNKTDGLGSHAKLVNKLHSKLKKRK